MRVFFFSPSNVCFCREKEEKKKITRFLYIFPVPIKIDLSSMAAAQQRQFLIFFSLSSREGGLFWQDQIWQTSRKRGRPSRFTSYSSSSKKLIFPPSGVFFLLAVDVVVGPRRFGPSLGLHRGGRYGILAPFQSSYPPDSVTRRLSHCVVSHCERFCQQNFFFFSREFLARGLASRPSFLPPPKFLCENRLGRKREKVVKILLGGGGGFSS